LYTDAIQVYQWSDVDGTPWEVEQTAGILGLRGRLSAGETFLGTTHTHDFTIIGGTAAAGTDTLNIKSLVIGKEEATNRTAIGTDSATKGGVVTVISAGTNTQLAGSATNDRVDLPCGGSILGFGLIVKEAITSTATTRCRVAVKYVSVTGAAAVSAATLDFPTTATTVNDFTVDAKQNTRYDGSLGIVGPTIRPSTATAAQAQAVGSRVIHPGFVTTTGNAAVVLPYALAPGSNIYVEATVAASGGTAAGGSFDAFVIVRHHGPTFPASAASPVILATIAS